MEVELLPTIRANLGVERLEVVPTHVHSGLRFIRDWLIELEPHLP